MLKAVIFDFNGIILDDEPLHFAAMRKGAACLGIDLQKEVYWERYLPLADRECLEAICRDHSIDPGQAEFSNALVVKSRTYHRLLQDRAPLFAGAAEFIKAAAQYPLAIASGARRQEIESTLESTGLRRYFVLILAAEDFVQGKPHPESFLLTLERLNRKVGSGFIQPGECLVVEDSVAGVHGAKSVGMICLAVTNSYPRQLLQAADRVVASLAEVQFNSLQTLFEESV